MNVYKGMQVTNEEILCSALVFACYRPSDLDVWLALHAMDTLMLYTRKIGRRSPVLSFSRFQGCSKTSHVALSQETRRAIRNTRVRYVNLQRPGYHIYHPLFSMFLVVTRTLMTILEYS
jgi:hypothetical protein